MKKLNFKKLIKECMFEVLTEVKASDFKSIDKAAIYLIKNAWQHMDKKNRFNHYEFIQWVFNEQELNYLFYDFSEQFFPGDPQSDVKFREYLMQMLEKVEQQYQKRKEKKIDKEDPLFILKQCVKNKSFEQAKRELMNVSLAGRRSRMEIPNDVAEQNFNIMYRVAMGETQYDPKNLGKLIKLSDLKRLEKGQDIQGIDNHTVNAFIDQFVKYDALGFPEKVKVYRGVNSPHAKIRPGDYVTFNRDYAHWYRRSKYGSIMIDTLNSKDLYVDKFDLDRPELIYWPEGHQIKKYEGKIPTFQEFWNHWK